MIIRTGNLFTMRPNDHVTVDQAAKILGVNPETLRRRVSRGTMPAPVRIGKRNSWKVSTLKAWMRGAKP